MKRRLHIGGTVRTEGWEVLDIQPGGAVDHVGSAHDLSRFDDASFAEIYASHVLEHLDFTGELQSALQEWCRVLEPGGTVSISVPDMDTLAQMFLAEDEYTLDERLVVMAIMFGGHTDAHDFHKVGLNEALLRRYLEQAGFESIDRVETLCQFDDTSSMRLKGTQVSLNVRARKPEDRP